MSPTQAWQYIASAALPKQFPACGPPEVAFIGRSNVGKSSLINMLTGISGLARVSRTPGKTRMINFFEFGQKWRLVDLPGYGYARLSKTETARWQELIESYLLQRDTLAAVLQLIDSRHPPMDSDMEMLNWLCSYQIPAIIALTKTDKLGKNEARKIVHTFEKQWLSRYHLPIVCTSAENRTGRDEILGEINRRLAARSIEEKPAEQNGV